MMPSDGAGWRVLTGAVLLMMAVLGPSLCQALVAQCPQSVTGPPPNSYCDCGLKKIRSGVQVVIKCDFMKREDVTLTEALYPLWRTVAVSVYVQVRNATSVTVTEGFMRTWLGLPAVGLDLWNCGAVNLVPAPLLHRARIPTFTTSVGIGVVGCQLKELPAKLLRDRASATLRIHNTIITTIRPGFLHNIRKLRHLVMTDSSVGRIEGPLCSGGGLRLGDTHTAAVAGGGVILANVTVGSLATGTFNFTNKGDGGGRAAKMEVTGSRVGKVGSAAFTVTGNIAVTIKNNMFTDVAPQAFKINITADLKFEENVAVRADQRALEAIICGNVTSMDKNTVHIHVLPGQNTTLVAFHPSCGLLQMFKVVSPTEPLLQVVESAATWVLLAALLFVLLAVAVVTLLTWRQNNKRREFTRDDSFHFHNGLMSSASTQAAQQQQEGTDMEDIPGEGVENPLYEDMEYKSSL